MLTWNDEIDSSNTGQISTLHPVLETYAAGMLRCLDTLLMVIRNRYIPEDRRVVLPDEKTIKNLCLIFKELPNYLRLVVKPFLRLVKLTAKRQTPLCRAGFFNACKLNLRDAP